MGWIGLYLSTKFRRKLKWYIKMKSSITYISLRAPNDHQTQLLWIELYFYIRIFEKRLMTVQNIEGTINDHSPLSPQTLKPRGLNSSPSLTESLGPKCRVLSISKDPRKWYMCWFQVKHIFAKIMHWHATFVSFMRSFGMAISPKKLREWHLSNQTARCAWRGEGGWLSLHVRKSMNGGSLR